MERIAGLLTDTTFLWNPGRTTLSLKQNRYQGTPEISCRLGSCWKRGAGIDELHELDNRRSGQWVSQGELVTCSSDR